MSATGPTARRSPEPAGKDTTVPRNARSPFGSTSHPTRAGRRLRRVGALVASVAAVIALSPVPTADAITPWKFNPSVDIAPKDAPPGPEFPMKQTSLCATSARLKGSQFDSVPLGTVWEVDKLHGFATGRGQTVAVIDSGVSRNVRLPDLIGGGDYIMGGDGLFDCDHHGTLVAGIIAAKPSPRDGFVGLAPDSTIVSIRQTSGAYSVDSRKVGNARAAQAASNLTTLAKSIVHAASMNASVINISVTACVPTTTPTDLHALAGALYYAAVVKNAVVVTAAGNLGDSCSSNPGPSPSNPSDQRGWSTVQTLSLPSMFSDFVLSVGGTTLTGDPYINTMPGPWVGVAAPAINVVSLDPSTTDGALINAQETKKGVEPIAGTSFSSAAVSGLAALIRQRYPKLTSHQVIERIKQTAHNPSQALSSLVGAGIVDPMAALTGPVDTSIPALPESVSSQAAVPGAPTPPPDHLARNVALISLGVLGGAGFVVALIAVARSGRKEEN